MLPIGRVVPAVLAVVVLKRGVGQRPHPIDNQQKQKHLRSPLILKLRSAGASYRAGGRLSVARPAADGNRLRDGRGRRRWNLAFRGVDGGKVGRVLLCGERLRFCHYDPSSGLVAGVRVELTATRV
jgi:hypothetical protein